MYGEAQEPSAAGPEHEVELTYEEAGTPLMELFMARPEARRTSRP